MQYVSVVIKEYCDFGGCAYGTEMIKAFKDPNAAIEFVKQQTKRQTFSYKIIELELEE